MAKTIVFTDDDDINGVPMKKGTEKSVSESIAEDKISAKVAKEKKTTNKKEVKDGN